MRGNENESPFVLCTVVVAAVHLCTRKDTPEGFIVIEAGDQEIQLSIAELDSRPIEGVLTDGKGEQHPFSAEGLLLAEVLQAAEVKLEQVASVTVLASDEYSAEVSGEEVLGDAVNLILQEDSSVELVVLSDQNRKRNVSNVARLIVE